MTCLPIPKSIIANFLEKKENRSRSMAWFRIDDFLYDFATLKNVLPQCYRNLSGTPLMMLILINSHLELKNGVSNVIIEDLGVGGRNVAIFNKFSKMMLNVLACTFMSPQHSCGSNIRLKSTTYSIFYLIFPWFSVLQKAIKVWFCWNLRRP